jgi:hypothetical protein
MDFIKKNLGFDYNKEKTVKDILVLHFTAGGSLIGAETELMKPDKINVPHIMDRDGKVYEYFDPKKYWAYHTGVKEFCRRSIGLEIVNWGPLKLMYGYFLPWTEWDKSESTFDKRKAVSPERVFTCTTFRGHEYFEMLTHKQYAALPNYIDTIFEQGYPITRIMTHAEISKQKLDFPPDFAQIYDLIKEYNEAVVPGGLPLGLNGEIPEGKEYLYSKERIQSRINWLIRAYGWHNVELKRLIAYRDKLK